MVIIVKKAIAYNICYISILTIAGMLYIAFNPYNKSLALIGTIFRLGEGLLLSYNEIESLALLNIAKEYVDADGAEKIVLKISSFKILQNKSSRFILGLNLLHVSTLVYCVLFLSSEAIPILISGLGFAASTFSVLGTSTKLAKPYFEILYKIDLPLVMLFEIMFGAWLLFFN